MATEYEQLLSGMLARRKEKLETLQEENRTNKRDVDSLLTEIAFVQGELDRYRRAMALFRSSELPKVGRWGKEETGEQGEALP